MRWEYLSLGYEATATPTGTEWEITSRMFIHGPKDAERHPMPAETPWITVLNDLGSAGWELVNQYVMETAVGPTRGYTNSGFPIRVTALFKRPVPDTA
jgi:hypothetical protein